MLTKRFCDTITVTRRQDFADAQIAGLAFRVTPTGAKSWSLSYYRPGSGRRARLTLGHWPSLGLAEARKKARSARAALDRGDDPGAPHASRVAITTFDELADLYMERHARPNKRSWARDEELLDRDIRPVIGQLPVDRITRSDVLAVIDRVEARGGRVQPQRVFEVMRGTLRWGLAEDFIQNDPTWGMKRRASRVIRSRYLTDLEIARLWRSLDGCGLSGATVTALRLALATGQRIGEVCGARITEFDLGNRIWRIPGTRTKNRLDHQVPLGDVAIAQIETALKAHAGQTWLLASRPRRPGPGRPIEQPLQPSAAAIGLRRKLAELGLADNPVTPHDFRRTMATVLQRLGYSEAVVARLLNHASDTARTVTAAVYMKHAFHDEKRAAMTTWDDHLQSLVGGVVVDARETAS